MCPEAKLLSIVHRGQMCTEEQLSMGKIQKDPGKQKTWWIKLGICIKLQHSIKEQQKWNGSISLKLQPTWKLPGVDQAARITITRTSPMQEGLYLSGCIITDVQGLSTWMRMNSSHAWMRNKCNRECVCWKQEFHPWALSDALFHN